MVEIAKALSLDARILIMDEPTSALTDHETRRLFGIIRELKAQGRAIIYISHRLEEVAADRRPGHGAARRAADRHPRRGAGRRPQAGRHDGRPRTSRSPCPRERRRPGPRLCRVEGLNRGGALRDIGFRLHEGEILGLAGLVGAGRTEVARAVFGVDRLDSGRIWVCGRPVTVRHPADATRLGIGFVTDDRLVSGLMMTMSVLENATLPSLRQFGALGGLFLSLPRERRAAQQLVRDLKVQPPSLERKVRYLSGGNQQKVVSGQVADGPLPHPDPRRADAGNRCRRQGGRATGSWSSSRAAAARVLLVSSDLPEVLRMSDRIVVMREGRIAGELSRAEATERAGDAARGGRIGRRGGPGRPGPAPLATVT